MRSAFDREAIERARARLAGLATARPRRRSGLPPVPDILACTYDPGTGCFRVIYDDGTALTVRRDELADVGDREVMAWSLDEFRRGVEIVLEDGVITSFSAEFPFYLRVPGYRRKVDARRAADGADLGERVAARVRTLRRERGWTVAELARRCGMAAPNVHRIESGRHVPSTRTLLRLAHALGVPLEALVRA